MRIKVQFSGPVRVMLKRKEEEVVIPSRATLSELLNKLISAHGPVFEGQVFERFSRKVRDGYIVMVNGISIRQLQGLETELRDEDTVTLIPFLAAGG